VLQATCGGPRPASVPRRTPQPDGRSPASWRSRHSPLYVAPCSAWRRFTRPRSTRQTLWIVAAGGRPVPVQRRSTESADRRYPHGRPSACGQSAPAEPRIGLASTSGQTAIATAADVTDRKDSVHISTRDRASVDRAEEVTQSRYARSARVSPPRAAQPPSLVHIAVARSGGSADPPGWLPQASRVRRAAAGPDWAGMRASPAMPGFVQRTGGYAESNGRAGLHFQAR
jgi:hypothetical protein